MNPVDLAFKLFGMRGDLLRDKDLLSPAMNELEKVLPELISSAQRIQQELFPHQVRNRTCASFDVFWVQHSLNSLGEKLDADGELGEATMEAVRRFQVKRNIVPQDGIPGRDTCVKLYADTKK